MVVMTWVVVVVWCSMRRVFVVIDGRGPSSIMNDWVCLSSNGWTVSIVQYLSAVLLIGVPGRVVPGVIPSPLNLVLTPGIMALYKFACLLTYLLAARRKRQRVFWTPHVRKSCVLLTNCRCRWRTCDWRGLTTYWMRSAPICCSTTSTWSVWLSKISPLRWPTLPGCVGPTWPARATGSRKRSASW